MTRIALLDLVVRAVVGGGIPARDSAWIRSELRLSGFRKTAKSYLLKRMAGAGLAQGQVTILFRALDAFMIACAATDFGVGWELLEKGSYEPHVTEFYRRTLRPGMCVADIGANIGFHALHAAVLVGEAGRVLAVEPDPQSAALLRLSLTVNVIGGADRHDQLVTSSGRDSGLQGEGLTAANPGTEFVPRASPAAPWSSSKRGSNGIALPVEVIEAALSDRAGEVVQSDLGNAGNSGARFTHRDRAALETLVHGVDPVFRTARAIVWDETFPEAPLDLVKIDIEGYEPHAIRGMERSLARHRPIVLSEFAPSNLQSLGGTPPTDYLRWFAERGYACGFLDEPSAQVIPADAQAVMARVAGRHHLDLVFSPIGS